MGVCGTAGSFGGAAVSLAGAGLSPLVSMASGVVDGSADCSACLVKAGQSSLVSMAPGMACAWAGGAVCLVGAGQPSLVSMVRGLYGWCHVRRAGVVVAG